MQDRVQQPTRSLYDAEPACQALSAPQSAGT